MKKIKYLLFGIVGLFGFIGFSHGFTYNGVEYADGVYHSDFDEITTYIFGDYVQTWKDKLIGQTNDKLTGRIYNNEASLFVWGNTYAFSGYGVSYSNGAYLQDGSDYGPFNPYYFDIVPTYVNRVGNNWINTGYDDMYGNISRLNMSTICTGNFYLPDLSDLELYYYLGSNLGNSFFIVSSYTYKGSSWDFNPNFYFLGWSRSPFKSVCSYTNSCTAGNVADLLVLKNGSNSIGGSGMPIRCIGNNVRLPAKDWDLIYGGSTGNLPSYPTDILPEDGGSQEVIITTGGNQVNLYWNCVGPVYNTPDGLPPAYCYNSSGELDPQSLLNCYSQLEVNSSGEIVERFYCYNDGFVNQVVPVENGSGVSFVSCTGIECFDTPLSFINSDGSGVFTEDYFNGFFSSGSSASFFTCPFPYKENLALWPALETFLGKFKILRVPSCFLSAFEYGLNVSFLGSPGGSGYWEGPLFNSGSDSAIFIYRFLDLLLGFGLSILILKIFKLI